MSRFLARLNPKKVLRRRVPVAGGVELVVYLRVHHGRTEMALGKPGMRRAKLPWRSIADVAGAAFGLEVRLPVPIESKGNCDA